MRPRFSLKLLLIVFTVFGFLLYLLYVRPTVLAKKYVAAVNRGDYQYAESLCIGNDPYFLAGHRRRFDNDSTLTADVVRRSWWDVWSFRRRILIRVTHPTALKASNGKLIHVGYTLEAAAGTLGVYHWRQYPQTFSAADVPDSG